MHYESRIHMGKNSHQAIWCDPELSGVGYLTNSFHQRMDSGAIDKIDYEKFHSITLKVVLSHTPKFNYSVSPALLKLSSTMQCAQVRTLVSMSSALSAKNVENMGTFLMTTTIAEAKTSGY